MDKNTIEEAKNQFSDSQDAWGEQRNAALEDIRFARLAEQWPETIERQREQEKRPCLTINKMPAFIRQVVNDARINSPQIKVNPVDDNSDPETAEVYNGIIRNIEYTSNAEVAYDSALDNAVTCGFGYFRIGVDYARDDVFELDANIERIANPLSVYGDETSVEVDSSDWNKAFVTEVLSKSQFNLKYPGAECSDWEGDYDDTWLSDDTVRVAEWWTREEKPMKLLQLSNGIVLFEDDFLKQAELYASLGLQVVQERDSKRHTVRQRIITPNEVLEDNPFPGRFIPIIPVYGDEVVVEGKRYFLSLIRQSKDAQRMFNYWRTASTELVALAPKAPYIGPVGAFTTDPNWSTANVESHAYLEYDGQTMPQRQPFAGPPAGALQEALNANDDMKAIMGLHDASLGARSNETSGRAIRERKMEGDVSTFHFIDNLTRAMRHAGRVLLDVIPAVYDKPRVMRVMGMDGSVDTVQVNQEFERNGVAKLHDLTVGKYDVVVETGPGFTTQREEARETMIEMVRTQPELGRIIGDLIAKSMDFPEADEIAKRLKAVLPPEIQALEDLDGIPPEAQALVGQAQAQVKQLAQIIEQGKAVIAEKDAKITDLEKKVSDKTYETDAKVRIAEMNNRADERLVVLEAIVEEIRNVLPGLVGTQPVENVYGGQVQNPGI